MKYYEIENLYIENISCNDLIDILNSNNEILEYYGIIHDMDVKEDTGEIKKPHYHLFISYNDYGRYTIDKVREFFKPLTNRINAVKSFKNAIQYLIHYNDKNKYQYNVDNIFTNNKDKMLKCFDEKEKSLNDFLNDFIDKIYHFYFLSFTDIIQYFKQNNKTNYLISHYTYLKKLYDDIINNYECNYNNEKEENKKCS